MPAPDRVEAALPQGHLCLVTADGTAATAELVRLLARRGHPVMVLTFPDPLMPAPSCPLDGLACIPLRDLGAAALAEAVAQATRRAGAPVGALVHLHPAFSSVDRPVPQARANETAILRTVFLLAKCLSVPLRQAAAHGRPAFLTVARLDGRLGRGGSGDWSPLAGGLFGLVKTLRLEWDGVFCRGVDLHPALGPQPAAERIMAELDDPNLLLSEIGYDSRLQRTTAAAERAAGTMPDATSLQALTDPSWVCLVSGGAKGITAQCAAELARRYRWKLLLLGRTEITGPEPPWVAGCATESEIQQGYTEHLRATGERVTPTQFRQAVAAVLSRREVEATLRTLAQAGNEAEYRAVDLTDATALAELLRSPEVRRLGPIRGLIHGAGSLADRRIENKTEQDFERVYPPKAEGLANLLDVLDALDVFDAERLECLVLFSSVAGFYGNPGQSDYAMANATLDAYAERLRHRHPSCRTLSIGWGPWDAGMVTPELRDLFLSRRLTLITAEEGPRLLADELARQPDPRDGGAQRLFGGPIAAPEWTPPAHAVRLLRTFSLEENPFLHDHRIGGRPVLPATCALSWMAGACEQLCPGWTLFRCADFAVLKGIILGPESPRELVLELRRIDGDAGADALDFVAFVATVSSAPGAPGAPGERTAEARATVHYRAKVRLLRTPPPPSPLERRREELRLLPGSPYGEGGLFHGSVFQGIRKVYHAGGDELLLECRLPAPAAGRLGRFEPGTLNAFTLDVQGQGILIWARQQRGALCLPARIASVEIFRPLSFDQDFFVSMQVRSQTDAAAVADVISFDAAGAVFNSARGIEVTFAGSQRREKENRI